ncbi:ATPase, T2SS/T4P/T4SS family [Thermofilum sp.]|jgi:type IV secretory pathway ATPase VirB11/archaellum biosynthesis ATPase|uniref:ATPase, T2SS/T4P/T4SS family n=1 Tax=Thermofilum sp. TaxID=1961369 RepID=UPI00258309B4|nr:ATPase, T2SS/T4P/T4SS family [Thermofilum sp.]
MRKGLFSAKLDKNLAKEVLGEGAVKEKPEQVLEDENRQHENKSRLKLPSLKPGKPRVPRLEVKLPSLKSIPRVKTSRGSLEGAETLEMPSGLGNIVRTSSGSLMFLDDIIAVYPRIEDGAFGPLQPLTEIPGLQEIFISEAGDQANIIATVASKRYKVVLPRQLLVDRLAERIAITSGINISEKNPQAAGEYHGYRVNLSMPLLSGGWQITLTKLSPPQNVSYDPLLTARLLTLLAIPASMLIYGPPGSGKTTLLIHLVNTLARLYSSANVSIVEKDPEAALHIRAPNVRKYFSSSDRTMTDNIRITRRYDRPDILIVGELQGEEVLSWFEAAGSGIPVLTTVHARTLRDAVKRLDTIIQSSGIKASIMDVIPVYVETSKVLTNRGIERKVGATYLLTEGGLQPVSKGEMHIPEEDFVKLLPPTLQFSLARDAQETYEIIKARLGINMSNYHFVKLEKVRLDELPE